MSIKVGYLEKGNYFYHENVTYKVLEVDYVFVKAEKMQKDGTTHYFLNSIEVEKDIIDNYQYVNPNWVISDLRKQNND